MAALFFSILVLGGALSAGRHNTDPITACVNYNPGELTLTGGPSGGAPPYTLQWQMGSSVTGPWSDIPGASMPVYDPENLLLPGTYCFSCLVTDSLGDTARTTPKVITIVPDPVVTVNGGGVVCPGEPVVLRGEVSGGTGKIKLQWYQSPDGLSGWFAVNGATMPDYTAPTAAPGLTFYRLRADATGSACSKPWSNVLIVLVADTLPPTFTPPPGPLLFCVEPIVAAGYDPGNDSIVAELPDFYRLSGEDAVLDPDTALFHDNCCPPGSLILHWRLDFSGGSPAPVSGTGTPSQGLAGILLPGDELSGQPVTHLLSYALEDCRGNFSHEQSVALVVRPRPLINF
jgi:hypothetical protein